MNRPMNTPKRQPPIAILRGAIADLDRLALGEVRPSDLDDVARRLERVADLMAQTRSGQ